MFEELVAKFDELRALWSSIEFLNTLDFDLQTLHIEDKMHINWVWTLVLSTPSLAIMTFISLFVVFAQ